MKKSLSVLLAVVMLLSTLSVAAFAANNGPCPVDEDWGFSPAFISLQVIPDDGEEGEGYSIYSAAGEPTQNPKGVSYDAQTNSLILDNYVAPGASFTVNAMGDDFKVVVKGNCEIAHITSWGWGWSGNVTFTGTGTLDINKALKIYHPLVIVGEGTDSGFKFDSDVKVNLYAPAQADPEEEYYQTHEYVPTLMLGQGLTTDKKETFITVANGQKIGEIKVADSIDITNTHVKGYQINSTEDEGWRGYKATKADDPEGIYSVSTGTYSDGRVEYTVTKYVYLESKGIYIEDEDFLKENATRGDEVVYSAEEFDAKGYSLNVTGLDFKSVWFWVGSEPMSFFALSKTDDPNGEYGIDWASYSRDDEDLNKSTFAGTIYKFQRDKYGELSIDNSFEPIAVGDAEKYETVALPAGFTVVPGYEYEELYLMGEYDKYDWLGLYEDAQGTQYGIYNINNDHVVYNLEPIEGVEGAYFITENTDVKYADLTEVEIELETDTFDKWLEGTEFKYVGGGATPISFPDVKSGAWYYDAAQYCAQKGYISGYQNGNFGPNDNLKRQDFVVILSKIAGADLDKYAAMTPKLKDVKKGAYYAAAVNWAVDNNIIAGYANGNFGVNDNITREQVATILYRYMGSPEIKDVDKTLAKFKDVNRISSFAKTAVAWAVQNNVISGMADGRVAPTEGAARAQIASIIMRMDQQGMFVS